MEERKKNKKKMDDTQPWMRKLHAPFQKFCKTSTTSSFSLVALIHRIESPPTSFPYPPSTSPLGFSSFFVLSLSLALYFHYSLSIPSSRQPLMMKTQSSIYKILSRSLSLFLRSPVGWWTRHILLFTCTSEIVTKRRWENPSSNKFLLHILLS